MSRNFNKKKHTEWNEAAMKWLCHGLPISSSQVVPVFNRYCLLWISCSSQMVFFFKCHANTVIMPSSCHGESNLLGGKRFSQPGTCDVDVVLLARYASRAVPKMKQATRKLTAHEMPRMPMVKTTASMKEFPRQKHLLKMHSDCKGFPQNIQKPKSFSSLNLQKNHSMIEDWTPSTGFPMDEVLRYVVFPWSQVQ